MNLTFTEEDILHYGVSEVIGKEMLVTRIGSSKTPLKVKLGIDPTGPNMHLGHTLPIWRLRAFQELGHEIHLIIGDFTGQIGDTSDKDKERPMLSEAEVQSHMQRYEEQLWMILNKEKADQIFFHRNSEWLAPLSFAQVSYLAGAFSVNDFIKRELVAKRLDSGSRVSMRELMYPIMQGYDSVAINADVELGGTDQRFNLLAGRALQEQAGKPEQSLIMNVLVAGLDGRKMSKSLDNGIYLLDTPADKFGKAMSAHDDVLAELLLLIPRSAQPFTQETLATRMSSGENPRDIKLEIASAIVELYHGAEVAQESSENWQAQFSQHQLPETIEEIAVAPDTTYLDLLVQLGWVTSKGDGRRVIEQGGVRVNGETLENPLTVVEDGVLVQKGKRQLARIRIS